jgi:hypothetical protein
MMKPSDRSLHEARVLIEAYRGWLAPQWDLLVVDIAWLLDSRNPDRVEDTAL